MIMGREKNTMMPDYVHKLCRYTTNAQTDTITHNKIQTDKQEDQSNKGVPKKSMIQQTTPKLCLHRKKIAFAGRIDF